MSWKTVKEHYNIEHIVHIRDGRLMIGSPLCSELFEFDLTTGKLMKSALGGLREKDSFPWGNAIADDADSGKLAELIAVEDKFGPLLSVWTHDYAQVIEKQCEERGWPNCCTDGQLMYNSDHFATRKAAARDLAIMSVHSMRSTVEYFDRQIDELKRRREAAFRGFKGMVRSIGLQVKFEWEIIELEKIGARYGSKL
jgi:hypothetical protein